MNCLFTVFKYVLYSDIILFLFISTTIIITFSLYLVLIIFVL
jgi:hypothetical protein